MGQTSRLKTELHLASGLLEGSRQLMPAQPFWMCPFLLLFEVCVYCWKVRLRTPALLLRSELMPWDGSFLSPALSPLAHEQSLRKLPLGMSPKPS